MAKLPRITQKIFAGNAPTNQVTTFGSVKAGAPVYSKNPADIMNSNFETGWSAAVDDDYAPYRQDRNGIDTVTTQQLGYIFQEGLPEWDSGTTYYIGSCVKYIDGNNVKFYRSIADNNTSALTDTTKWVLYLNIDNTGKIQSPAINTPSITGGSMSNGTFDNPIFTGTVTVPTPSTSDSSTKAASTAYVQNNLTGAISTVKTTNLTANRALLSNGSGKIAVSSVTNTELGYVSGVTSAIQTQINSKQATITGGASTVVSSNLTVNRAVISNGSGKIASSSVTSTELGYLSGVTSSIQTQISGLQTALSNLPQLMFPVGSIYSTVGNTNPSTILGFGTWSTIATSIITGASNPTVWGDGTHALGLEYYNKTNSAKQYGTMQQSAKHDYSNGTNVGTSLGIATKTTNNKLSDNYTNIGGQSYNGYSTGYGANVVSKGNGTSGLYADMSTIKTTIYIWKRTA